MQIKDRPVTLEGQTEKVRTGHGTMYVTTNWDNGSGLPFEMFATMGKAGGCEAAHLEALTRLVSLLLRSGVHPSYIIAQLRSINCHPYMVGNEKVMNSSPADAIARVLERNYEEVDEGNAEQTAQARE